MSEEMVWKQAMALDDSMPPIPHRTFLLYLFPQNKEKIAKLNYDQKMEWYGHQWDINPHGAGILFNNREFRKFWYWHVLLPMKIKRFYYRVKNFEIFKKYPSITEFKRKK